jgi:heat shock protein HspQ
MAWFLADSVDDADWHSEQVRVGYLLHDVACRLARNDRNVGGKTVREAKFGIGDVVEHRFRPFRGVIFDVDPLFNHTEEWWLSIPEEIRPRKDQPYYHVFAETDDTTYVAYVSEQNLVPDETHAPCRHPQLELVFDRFEDGCYVPKDRVQN